MECEPIRMDTEPEPEFERDPDYEYEVQRDLAGEFLEEESFKLVCALNRTFYYRNSNRRLMEHLFEAIARHLNENVSISIKKVDTSFKRVEC